LVDANPKKKTKTIKEEEHASIKLVNGMEVS
jgi:hypothetical protein